MTPEEKEELYQALIGRSCIVYEEVRQRLIAKYGYDTFADAQSDCFEWICNLSNYGDFQNE